MKTLIKFALIALLTNPLLAQSPQVPLTGSIGVAGNFPLVNSPQVEFITDADHTMTYPETSGTGGFIKVTSSLNLTATRKLIAPAPKGFQFTVENATTGGQSIQIIGPSGTGVVIANGSSALVSSDGTNYVQIGDLSQALLKSPPTDQIWSQAAGTGAAIHVPASDTVGGSIQLESDPVVEEDGAGSNLGSLIDLASSYVITGGMNIGTVLHVGANLTITNAWASSAYHVDAGGGNLTLTLPSTITLGPFGAQQPLGARITIFRVDQEGTIGTNTLTIAAGTTGPGGPDVINGLSSITLANGQAVTLIASELRGGVLPKPLYWTVAGKTGLTSQDFTEALAADPNFSVVAGNVFATNVGAENGVRVHGDCTSGNSFKIDYEGFGTAIGPFISPSGCSGYVNTGWVSSNSAVIDDGTFSSYPVVPEPNLGPSVALSMPSVSPTGACPSGASGAASSYWAIGKDGHISYCVNGVGNWAVYGEEVNAATTITVGSAAGTGATAICRSGATCNQIGGYINLNSGTATLPTGSIAEISTSGTALISCTANMAQVNGTLVPITNVAVSVQPASGVVSFGVFTALTASTDYIINYVCTPQ